MAKWSDYKECCGGSGTDLPPPIQKPMLRKRDQPQNVRLFLSIRVPKLGRKFMVLVLKRGTSIFSLGVVPATMFT